MNKEEMIKKYEEYRERLNAYELMINTVCFDKNTIAPVMGNKYRNQMLNIIVGEAYVIETDPEIIKLVDELSEMDLGEDLNRDVFLTKKSLESVSKFTKEEVMEFNNAFSESFDAWLVAKEKGDYSLFEKHLIKVIEIAKKKAVRRNPEALAYNVMLDDYEEGMTIERYDEFFKLIKEELLPLIKEVDSKKDYIDDSFLYKYYPKDKQALFNERLKEYICFDKSWGYLGQSEHPFTNGLSKNDVRITTNYDEYNIASNIFSVIHEVGHAHYEHNILDKYDGTNIKKYISSGMHESQSRFLENYVGRRKSFWIPLYPYLQELFPENLGAVDLDTFIKTINASKCSLIRTEADELTYPIHILIRYEIEKGLCDGSISCDKLNETWNQKYKEYLGVDVTNDRDGILQDVHWSDASFGYFPTYALGSAFGAQFLATIEKEMDLDNLLENGKFDELVAYLRDHIQFDGALHNYEYILNRATKEDFNPRYYVDYLKNKYTKLYE